MHRTSRRLPMELSSQAPSPVPSSWSPTPSAEGLEAWIQDLTLSSCWGSAVFPENEGWTPGFTRDVVVNLVK